MKQKFTTLVPMFIIFALLVGFMNTNGNDPKKGKQNTDPKLVSYTFTPPIEYRSPNAILKFVDSLDGDNTIAGLEARGYKTYFRGTPPAGTSVVWYQGTPTSIGYPAFNGPTTGFVQSDYNSIVAGNIDNWLVLPKFNISTGDSLYFYSGSYNSTAYPDSIRVMYSAAGDSLPEATSWVELGRFRLTSYMPNSIVPWAENGFRAPSSGTGRFAIRYCVFDGGPNGANSSTISVDYIRVISSAAYPLNAFNLLTPSAGVTITSINGSTTPVSITWDTSATGATYKWKYTSTSGPSRSLTIPVGTNSISSTLGALDGILAGIGLNPGDSTIGQWDVWAFKSPAATGPDSLKSTNGPRTITLKRQKPPLTAFSLVSPISGTSITTAGGSTTPININWTKSGAGTTYKWFYATPNFTNPGNIKMRLPADNSGLDTTLTTTSGAIDALIAGFVNMGDSTVGQWRVYAYSGNDSLASAQTNNITFKRAKVITIGSGTTSSNFPFTTYWKDGRTQYLYLASELAGTGTPAYITNIAFDVLTVGAPAMTDMTVSFKNTTETSLTTFVNDGLVVARTPSTYAPTGPGWNVVTMTTPFAYTPGQNLLIDICYNNTTYTSYSTVKCDATVPGTWWGRYNDLTEPNGGCGYTAWTLTTGPVGRANTQFTFSSVTGINQNTTEIPNVYSLSQNYPNPFNPTTKINFALPKQGLVTLKIYDVLGREVRTLVNEVKAAGSYTVDFNASEFSSGVYF
ncbi:MAG: choice-of-anchor J domain-containing protein, partial [Candidatus Kapaibacterium sp.]